MKNTVAQTADEQRVVEYIKAESKKRGCKVKIYSNRKLKNTLFECADGEFSEFDMEIRCLKDRKDKKNYWIGVLVHEYCHLLQCYNEEKVWQNFEDVTSEIEDGIIFKKSSEIQMPKRQRLNLAKAIIKLELDCEKKAVNLLKQLKTNIDYDYYIACANVILYKYIFWAETGKWITIKKNDQEFLNIIYELVRTNKINQFKNLYRYTSYKSIPINIKNLLSENA